MKPIRTVYCSAAVVLALAAMMTVTRAQPNGKKAAAPTAKAKKKDNPLNIRQERIQRMMQDLNRLMTQLAVTLKDAQPDQAARLQKAVTESKGLRLEARMTEIAKLLKSDGNLELAGDKQKALLKDLQRLIAILLADEDAEKRRQEIQQLQEWKERIRKILDEEKKQLAESRKLANKDDTLAGLDSQIKALENLIKRQGKVIKSTVDKRAAGIDKLGKVAKDQQAVRKDTDALAKQVAGESQSGSKDGSKAKSGSGSKSKSGSGSKSKSGSGSKSKSGSGSKSKSGSGSKPQSGSQSSQPGAKSLKQATQQQKSAEQKLQSGKGKAAEQDERKALDSMKKALNDLKKERNRIAKLPPEEFEKMAKKQDRTIDKSAKLSEDLKKGSQGSGSKSGSGSQSDSAKAAAKAQKQVQKAQQAMQQASAGLRKKSPMKAADDQKDAVDALKKALREIEERLKQLRDEMQEDKLARLEARFSEMLARQERISAATKTYDKKAQAGGGKLGRIDRLKVAKLRTEEAALAEEAQKALDVIKEDGTSVVFPRVVEHLRDDLKNVARMLDDKRVGKYTQLAQQEIELTLKELLDALKKAQSQAKKKKGGGGQGGPSGEPPLIPGLAELKLLKSAQLRVNRKTVAFDSVRGKKPLDKLMKTELKNLVAMQEEIAEMAREIADTLTID